MTMQMPQADRVALLKLAAERLGGNIVLGRRLGYKDGSYVGQMMRGERPITEKTLAKLSRLRELADIIALPPAAGACAPGVAEGAAPRYAAPTLAEALEVLGIELAHDLPAYVRQDTADALSKLAMHRGIEHYQQQVIQLLRPAGKRATANAA